MGYVTGNAQEPPLRSTFDRRIKLEFHGARITSDDYLLAYRELDVNDAERLAHDPATRAIIIEHKQKRHGNTNS